MENNRQMVTKSKPTAKSAKNVPVARKVSAHPAARRSTTDLTNIKIVTKKKETEKKPFPVATVALSICFTVLFLFMMMNYIALDDLSSRVEENNDTIMALKEEDAELERKVAVNDSPTAIKEYAENNLGMVNGDGNMEHYYVDIHGKDDVEINHYEDEQENGIGTLLTGAGSVLRKFFS